MQDNQQPIDSQEGLSPELEARFLDVMAGVPIDQAARIANFIDDQDDLYRSRIAQLEQRLKEAESRSVCRWVQVCDNMNEGWFLGRIKSQSGFSYCKIEITGNQFNVQGFASQLRHNLPHSFLTSIEWLEEIPAEQYNDQIAALKAELETQMEDASDQKLELSVRILNVIAEKEAMQQKIEGYEMYRTLQNDKIAALLASNKEWGERYAEAQRNLTSMISEALEKSKQLDGACRERDEAKAALWLYQIDQARRKAIDDGFDDYCEAHDRPYNIECPLCADECEPSTPPQTDK